MRESATQRKINEQAREALASTLLFDIADSRLREVTVTGCKVSPDRTHCTVFFEAPAGSYEEMLAGMQRAAGAIRTCMGRRLKWRVTPALQFVLDETVDEAFRISRAIGREADALQRLAPEGEVCAHADAYVADGEGVADADDAREAEEY